MLQVAVSVDHESRHPPLRAYQLNACARASHSGQDGFVAVDGGLSPAEVGRLTRLTERLRRAEPAAADGSLHALGPVSPPIELVDHPRVLELVCAIVGWNIHMYHCPLQQSTRRPPRPPATGDGAVIPLA